MKLNYYITALKVSRRKILKNTIPKFDKSIDDRYQKTNGKIKKPNIVIFKFALA